jgi:hypothetical protein
MQLLSRYPEFVAFRARAALTLSGDSMTQDASPTETPEEAIERHIVNTKPLWRTTY